MRRYLDLHSFVCYARQEIWRACRNCFIQIELFRLLIEFKTGKKKNKKKLRNNNLGNTPLNSGWMRLVVVVVVGELVSQQ